MKFKNLSRAQFSKLRNGINAVGEFRYDTIINDVLNVLSVSIIVQKTAKDCKGHVCTRESAIVQWRNVSITVSLLNQDFTHGSDRDFIITTEKSLSVIFWSISTKDQKTIEVQAYLNNN